MHIQYTFTQYQDSVLYTCFMCCTILFISFISPTTYLFTSKYSFLLDQNVFLSALSFPIFFSSFWFLLKFFILHIFLSMFSLIMSPFLVSSKSILGNDFRKSGKYGDIKTDSHVVYYGEQDGRLKLLGSETISGARMTGPDEFQPRLHRVDRNIGYGFDLVFIKAVVNLTDRFLILYTHEFRCHSMAEIPETLGRIFKYGFYVWDAQPMKVLCNKRSES